MPNDRPYRATVFVDADNTLWDTDRVYADAQRSMLTEVEAATQRAYRGDDRLAFVREVDQAIAERHHSGLRYPPGLLAHALALKLAGESTSAAVRRVLRETGYGEALNAEIAKQIEDRFLSALKAPPLLRAGVARALPILHRQGCLILVVTEGARDRVERTLDLYGLSTWVDRIVEAPKQTNLYQRVARLSRAPTPMFMVGDQLQRDIAPAKAAGLRTVYFPSGFRPRWEPAENSVTPDYRIDSFDEIPPLVAEVVPQL